MAVRSSEMNVAEAREEEVFVARQLHFANTLAGNDPKDRARAMKNLRKFLTGRSALCFTHDDFMRIWKGLFYCMWMSDKPLIQEELSEQISQLVHCFECVNITHQFIQAGFDTLMTEWYGIDHHRLDKFQMFLRRFLRQSLVFCKNEDWDDFAVDGLTNVFESTVLSLSKCNDECSDIGLTMHFVDIFIEELAKVSAGDLPNETLLKFLEPFIAFYAKQTDYRLTDVIRERIFHNLISQSPAGMEYEEKFEAWKRAGFPGKSWKEMVFVGKNDNRSGVKIKHLDPRAGKVDVYLPHIVFDAGSVVDMLRKYSTQPLKVCRQRLHSMINKFQNLASGKYPLTVPITKAMRDDKKYRFSKQLIDNAVEDLISFNKNLEKDARRLENDEKKKRKASPDNLKNPKKFKSEKKDYEKSHENVNLRVILKNKQDCVDENSSPDVENGGPNDCEESEASSKRKTQSKNILKKRKKNKLQNNLSWNVSQISKLQNEEGNVDETLKESTEVENSISSETVTDEAGLNSKSTILIDESHQQEEKRMQISALTEVIENETESKELNTEVECSSLKMKNDNSIDKNGRTVPDEEPIKTSLVDESQLSQENRDNIVQVAKDKEESNACNNVESPLKKEEITTPLRKSVRRRSSVIPEVTETIKKKKEVNGFLVEDSSTPISVKNTPVQNVKPKRKLSKIFSPIEIEWDDEESNLLKQAESSLEEQVSSASLTGIGAAKRISTVPDREIVVGQETELQENPAYKSLCVSPTNNGTVCNSSMIKAKEKLTPQRRSLRSLTKLKRASLHVTSKKVNIALQMNKSQDFTEYLEGVINSPTIQYDANKKPCKGVLKQTSIRSPINPFYKPPKGIGKI